MEFFSSISVMSYVNDTPYDTDRLYYTHCFDNVAHVIRENKKGGSCCFLLFFLKLI